MRGEQGTDPVPPGPQDGPVTALGSNILKAMANRYASHPDFNEDWVPDNGMPNLR